MTTTDTMSPPAFIPYGRQDINQADIDAVVDVLEGDWLTQGPAIERFEQAVADATGAKYAVAISSCTAGLHIACLAAGLSRGDTLWTSPNTFVASANAARYCGANVDFVDIDPQTYNISISALADKLTKAKATNTLPKVVIPVHFSGQACNMAAIHQLSQEFGFTVIEDAAHAIGASYQSVPVGQCQHSAMTVFSFHPVKIVTTAEGGVVTTNDNTLYDQLIMLRSHGITKEADKLTSPAEGGWSYEQQTLGYHYRMTDIQAALGASQVQRLPEFIARRRQLAAQYDEMLADLPVIRPYQAESQQSSWHLYVVQIDSHKTSTTRKAVFDGLRAANIGVQIHYIPVHTQPYYKAIGFNRGDFPVAESYYQQAISLPMYPTLTDAEQQRVVATLRGFLA